jgi:lipid II:glycine glycyltransferase (peptidoglycan interpeptide bridge formation enzyme)
MEIVTESKYDEYNSFVAACPKGSFMQTTYWAKVKEKWEFAAIAERGDNGEIIGSIGMLIRKVPGTPFTMVYSPRGPVCDIENHELVKKLVSAAVEYAKKRNAYEFKIDPDVLSSNTEFLETFLSLGFDRPKETKCFETIQPRYVFRLNVKGRTMDELMASFHQKTRYNIRVAIKNGVVIEQGSRREHYRHKHCWSRR